MMDTVFQTNMLTNHEAPIGILIPDQFIEELKTRFFDLIDSKPQNYFIELDTF